MNSGYFSARILKSGRFSAYGFRGCIALCYMLMLARWVYDMAYNSRLNCCWMIVPPLMGLCLLLTSFLYLCIHVIVEICRSIKSECTSLVISAFALYYTLLHSTQTPASYNTNTIALECITMTTPMSTTGAKPVGFTDYIWAKCKSQPLIPAGTSA